MRIHSGKAKIRNRRGLEGVKDFVAANPACPVFLKELRPANAAEGSA